MSLSIRTLLTDALEASVNGSEQMRDHEANQDLPPIRKANFYRALDALDKIVKRIKEQLREVEDTEQAPAPQPAPTFRPFIAPVPTPEVSREVQEWLFGKGWWWSYAGDEVLLASVITGDLEGRLRGHLRREKMAQIPTFDCATPSGFADLKAHVEGREALPELRISGVTAPRVGCDGVLSFYTGGSIPGQYKYLIRITAAELENALAHSRAARKAATEGGAK